MFIFPFIISYFSTIENRETFFVLNPFTAIIPVLTDTGITVSGITENFFKISSVSTQSVDRHFHILITLVFYGTGWVGYDPNPGVDVIFGLKLLMFVFPAIALTVSVICWKIYELHGETLEKMREELAKHPEIK